MDLKEQLKEQAEKLGHIPTLFENNRLKSVHCSCGWDSRFYINGQEHAYREWEAHIAPIVESPRGVMRPGEDLKRNR